MATLESLSEAHRSQERTVLEQRDALAQLDAAASSGFSLDNMAEGTWTLYSADLLAKQPATFVDEYDAECDEWVLEFYDTDFANELYPGSFCEPGEVLTTLHVGERHIQFSPVPRPEQAVPGMEPIVLRKAAKKDQEGNDDVDEATQVTAELRMLGQGCLTLEIEARHLLGAAAGSDKLTLYGTFEEEDEDLDIVAADGSTLEA